MDFGFALQQLKSGNKVSREEWKGQEWIWILHPYAPHPDDLNGAASNFINPYFRAADNNIAGAGTMSSWIGMKTADNKFVPWLASQTDLLAEDWVIVI